MEGRITGHNAKVRRPANKEIFSLSRKMSDGSISAINIVEWLRGPPKHLDVQVISDNGFPQMCSIMLTLEQVADLRYQLTLWLDEQ